MALSQSTVAFVLPVGEVTMTLKDVLYIFGLPIDGGVVTDWTDSSQDFLVIQSLTIFGSEPVIGTYNWGTATIAHLYRSLCRASRCDCKEMDDPLGLFVWVGEKAMACAHSKLAACIC
ncbi:hypothetical protein Ahy_A08g038519 [Arachis hypogaea]|uniref:Aminotransferase-like plant mobile domain-containing protein n=1 Tax=Arachis hypogaea TaxID=3818 RepID=A0A445BU08_ARAHY|nr:hypothetical protein Ahy_A08g038519 [Arachis hypogaea]